MADVLSNRSVLLTTVEVFSIIIFNVLTLTGNIMVCIAVYKNTRLRTTTNLYIIALAVSDLMSGVFVMPFAMGVLITGDWVYGRVICNCQAYMTMFVVYVSPVTMGLTAFNRYIRICKSEQQYKSIIGLCMDPRCLLHPCSKVNRSSRLCACPRICPVRSGSSQSNWRSCPLRHCPLFSPFNSFIDCNIQLHKGCKDDPTAQCRNVIYDSQGRNRLKHHRARTEAE